MVKDAMLNFKNLMKIKTKYCFWLSRLTVVKLKAMPHIDTCENNITFSCFPAFLNFEFAKKLKN